MHGVVSALNSVVRKDATRLVPAGGIGSSTPLGDEIIPGYDLRPVCPGLPQRGQPLHDLWLLVAQIPLFRAVVRHVIEFPRPAMFGHEFSIADADGPVALVLPVDGL